MVSIQVPPQTEGESFNRVVIASVQSARHDTVTIALIIGEYRLRISGHNGRVRVQNSILLKKSSAKNDAKIFRSQMPYNRFSQHA